MRGPSDYRRQRDADQKRDRPTPPDRPSGPSPTYGGPDPDPVLVATTPIRGRAFGLVSRWVEVKREAGRQRYTAPEAFATAEASAVGLLVGEVRTRGGDALTGLTVTAIEIREATLLRVAGTVVATTR
ncbi:MAG: hypothetical protein AAF532_07525 [Planctomycetota bacterium]